MVHAHNNDGSSQIGFSGVVVSNVRPTTGQVLTAIDEDNAHWTTPSSGGGSGGSSPVCSSVNSDLVIVEGYDILIVDCSSPRNITLPSPVNGRTIVIKDATGQSGTNAITLIRYASEYIEGIAASKVLNSNWGVWKFVADANGNWFIIT